MNEPRKTRYFCARLLLVAITFPLALSCAALPDGARPTPIERLTILHFNDLHGQLEPLRDGKGTPVGGAARLAALVKSIRAENEQLGHPTLLLMAGDLFLGSSLSALYKGAVELEFLDRLRPDAMTLGNHEFDFGMEILAERIRQAGFPIISANSYRGGERLVPPVIFKEVGGRLRVGIVGLITPDTAQLAHPDKIAGTTFTDPVAEAKKLAAEVRARSDLFIALTHTGVEIDKRLAAEVPGLDGVVGGHDHVALIEPLKVGSVWIAQAQHRGLYLGRLDFSVEGRKIHLASGRLIPVTEELPEDQEVKDMIVAYRGKIDQKLKEVLGYNRIRLVGEPEKIRRIETNLGNLVADIMRKAARTEIALVNSGFIRGSVEEGPITVEDVWRVLPYDNYLARVELSGEQIEEMLRHSVSLGRGLAGGFLQVSGLSFTIAPSGPREIRVNGEPLERDRFYSVAVTDFLFAGGDGYSHLQKGRDRRLEPFLIRDLFLDYLKENKEISVNVEGRIRRQP